MKIAHSVLLIHSEADAFRGLEQTLREQQIQTRHARHCAEARRMLRRSVPVDLILTDAVLADGTWKDVIRLVRELANGTPVVVMSRVVNTSLYLDTQDGGAADFMVPPMAPRATWPTSSGERCKGPSRLQSRPRRPRQRVFPRANRSTDLRCFPRFGIENSRPGDMCWR